MYFFALCLNSTHLNVHWSSFVQIINRLSNISLKSPLFEELHIFLSTQSQFEQFDIYRHGFLQVHTQQETTKAAGVVPSDLVIVPDVGLPMGPCVGTVYLRPTVLTETLHMRETIRVLKHDRNLHFIYNEKLTTTYLC